MNAASVASSQLVTPVSVTASGLVQARSPPAPIDQYLQKAAEQTPPNQSSRLQLQQPDDLKGKATLCVQLQTHPAVAKKKRKKNKKKKKKTGFGQAT
ncbi:MAG: hypothetical protein FRX49_05360, partial [Trebouxia sp. A1-2]